MSDLDRFLRFWPIALVMGGSLLVTGCGGGGGGSPTTGVTTPVTPPAPPPPPPPPPPSVTSAEYTRSWGLAAIHANTAYDAGYTGSGVTVAVIDTGVDSTQADLLGRISSASTDIVTGRNELANPSDRHGARVAGVIASNFNGTGTIGVAYGSTILSIRADTASTDPDCAECIFGSANLARSIDYAVANGAKVINLSLGGETTLGTTFEAALARATAAGVVVAVAAGNEGEADPTWPARYAVDSRYQGSLLAVGALTQSGTLASFSNKAGVAANGYIVAPGEQVVTDCDAAGSCWRISGTSFAAPHVAGALALLLQAFPNISGRDAVSILLRTAADLGTSGTDSTYGRGSLDLTRAFLPVGTSSLAVGEGETTVLDTVEPGTNISGPFGQAMARADALTTVLTDDYNRRFVVDLAGMAPSASRRGVGDLPPPSASSAVVLGGPSLAGAQLAFSVEAPLFEDMPNASAPDLLLGPQPMRSARMQAAFGRFSFSTWKGEGGAPAPAGPEGRDAFRIVARPDQTVQAAVRVGRFAFSAEQGEAMRRRPLEITEIKASRYVSVTGQTAVGGGVLSVTAGTLDEPLGPLGSFLAPGSTFALPSTTRFTAAAFDLSPRPGVSLRAEASMGRMSGQGGLFGLDGVVSGAWRLAAAADCGLVGWSCAQLTFEISQPLRVEGGRFTATLADAPLSYEDPLTYSTRRFSASPDGREIDLRLGVEHSLGGERRISVRGGVALEPGHDASAAPELNLAATYRARF
ncbi:S8 family peptidase [Caulobacter hibisci]|uniref:S8 family serine peptidase n=1 Tax=Caulobacter hibisci TaxID=2035993 RepID=A0ABS0T4S8_9CAUL|nr:S8 family peptidase [Caulobacter hibisci]MBI1686891.1 S8 family serine peptidase [Caulobacter hibisci]